jgi:hypothetical protein
MLFQIDILKTRPMHGGSRNFEASLVLGKEMHPFEMRIGLGRNPRTSLFLLRDLGEGLFVSATVIQVSAKNQVKIIL